MKKLSFWARENPWKARIIIVLLHFVLIILALFTGDTLSAIGIQLPAWSITLFLSLFILAAIFYPSRHKRNLIKKDLYYIRQKSCDFLLAATGFCMMLCLANKNNGMVNYFQAASASSVISMEKEKPTAQQILASLQFRDKSTLTRSEKRILKKEFRVQLKNYVIATVKGNKAQANSALLIILAIVVALGVLILLAGICCSISCSGSAGLAIALFILGTAGIIWGLISVIRSINRKGKSK